MLHFLIEFQSDNHVELCELGFNSYYDYSPTVIVSTEYFKHSLLGVKTLRQLIGDYVYYKIQNCQVDQYCYGKQFKFLQPNEKQIIDKQNTDIEFLKKNFHENWYPTNYESTVYMKATEGYRYSIVILD